MRLSLRSLSKRSRTDVLCAAIIVVVVTFQWCLTVGIFYGQSLFEPLSYAGDGHFTAAAIAAGMRGEFIPFVSKEFPSLGAPFVASWNDFPIVEDWLYFWVGTFARIVGVFGAINIAYWAACIAAGLSMFFVARRGFHMGAPFATMSGILYGFTMYIVSRGTHHFSLIFYWIVPLQILTSAWLASRKGIAFKTKKFWFTMAVGLITGWSFIYYAFFAMQLYALALLVRMGRPKRLQPLMVAGCLALVTGTAIVSMSVDTIAFARSHGGPNEAAIYRNPTDVELYALKPISMLIPGGNHKFPFMRTLVGRATEQQMIQGEIPAPYQGMVGNVFLFGLVVTAAFAIAKRKLNISVTWALTVTWLIIGHGVGGENSVMGLAGLRLFRSVNRVSIVITAFVLLFAAWAMPRVLRRAGNPVRWAVAMVLAVFGTFEPIPVVVTQENVLANHRMAVSDKALVAEAEAALPKGSAVFELPVMDFPEVPGYRGVDSYELFRPYFFSHHLRYSIGDVKGRANGAWKFRVGNLPPPQMIAELKQNGFSAIYVNLKGFPGQEQAVIDAFVGNGARVVAKAGIGDSVFLGL